MLKNVIEKAKEVVLKVQEREQEARRNKCNTYLPEDPALVKKPGAPQKPAAAAPKGNNALPAAADAIPPALLTGHEHAINEEAANLILRLETISNFAAMIVGDVKKVSKALDTRIVQSIEETHRAEMISAGMLVDYVHAQIENEQPIRQVFFSKSIFEFKMNITVRVNTLNIPVFIQRNTHTL